MSGDFDPILYTWLTNKTKESLRCVQALLKALPDSLYVGSCSDYVKQASSQVAPLSTHKTLCHARINMSVRVPISDIYVLSSLRVAETIHIVFLFYCDKRRFWWRKCSYKKNQCG